MLTIIYNGCILVALVHRSILEELYLRSYTDKITPKEPHLINLNWPDLEDRTLASSWCHRGLGQSGSGDAWRGRQDEGGRSNCPFHVEEIWTVLARRLTIADCTFQKWWQQYPSSWLLSKSPYLDTGQGISHTLACCGVGEGGRDNIRRNT